MEKSNLPRSGLVQQSNQPDKKHAAVFSHFVYPVKVFGFVQVTGRSVFCRLSPALWALGNYSRFIRPGMIRVKCEVTPLQSVEDGLLISAYQDAENKVVMVCVNLSHQEKFCDPGPFSVKEIFITNASHNLERSPPNGPVIKIPARSVATVILESAN